MFCEQFHVCQQQCRFRVVNALVCCFKSNFYSYMLTRNIFMEIAILTHPLKCTFGTYCKHYISWVETIEEKKMGPRIDPWGTPHTRGGSFELLQSYHMYFFGQQCQIKQPGRSYQVFRPSKSITIPESAEQLLEKKCLKKYHVTNFKKRKKGCLINYCIKLTVRFVIITFEDAHNIGHLTI